MPLDAAAGPGIAEASRAGAVSLRTLTLIRWIGVSGQAAAILFTDVILAVKLPVGWALATVGVSAIVNLVAPLFRPLATRLSDREAARFLAFDTLQLAVLLFLTGGLFNPFCVLVLAPVTVSATVLSRNTTIGLSALTVGCITGLLLWRLPLPWTDALEAVLGHLSSVYELGIWVALVVATLFIAGYLWRVTEESRRISAALGATQAALAREQRLSALGGLAAAVAHELGSPLGTIAVVARELAHEVPEGSPLAEDVALLAAEADRCRRIMTQLSERPDVEAGSPFASQTLTALVKAAAAAHTRDGIELIYERRPDGGEAEPASGDAPGEPRVRRSSELLHGIGTLVQNAVQFARAAVEVTVAWDADALSVEIEDDGPGFPSEILDRLGEPYVSTRSGDSGHMGLGIFIASTLLERTGATVRFENRPEGGARVELRWRRGTIDAQP